MTDDIDYVANKLLTVGAPSRFAISLSGLTSGELEDALILLHTLQEGRGSTLAHAPAHQLVQAIDQGLVHRSRPATMPPSYGVRLVTNPDHPWASDR